MYFDFRLCILFVVLTLISGFLSFTFSRIRDANFLAYLRAIATALIDIPLDWISSYLMLMAIF